MRVQWPLTYYQFRSPVDPYPWPHGQDWSCVCRTTTIGVHRAFVQDLATAMAPCFVVILSGLVAVVGHYLWKHMLRRMEQQLEDAIASAGAGVHQTIKHHASIATSGADVHQTMSPKSTSLKPAGTKLGKLKIFSCRRHVAASVRSPSPRAAGSIGSPGKGRCDTGSSENPNPKMPLEDSLEIHAHVVSKGSALERARLAKDREGQGGEYVGSMPPDNTDGVDRELLQQLTKLNDRLDQLATNPRALNRCCASGAASSGRRIAVRPVVSKRARLMSAC